MEIIKDVIPAFHEYKEQGIPFPDEFRDAYDSFLFRNGELDASDPETLLKIWREATVAVSVLSAMHGKVADDAVHFLPTRNAVEWAKDQFVLEHAEVLLRKAKPF